MIESRKTQSRTVLGPGLILCLALLLLSACIAPVQPAPAGSEAPAGSGDELTVEQLKNATYSGIYDEPITLTDGMYEGEPFAEGGASRPTVWLIDDGVLFGDLNGDEVDDAAVLLVENSGGSGVFTYVGAQVNDGGQPVDAGAVWLGDRIQIISGEIVDGAVMIEMVTQGPGDAQCCATLKVRSSFALQDGLLAQTGSEELGNVSLDDLMGTAWVLDSLNPDQPTLPDIDVTANFADGQVSGSGGCNDYNASVSSDGGQSIVVGAVVSTRMACPDEIMNQELAYLSALENAFQWGYQAGKLAILYSGDDGTVGTLLYSPAPVGE